MGKTKQKIIVTHFLHDLVLWKPILLKVVPKNHLKKCFGRFK